jgi:hypothetical protein
VPAEYPLRILADSSSANETLTGLLGLDQTIRRDREFAHAHVRGVPNGVRDCTRGAGDTDLANLYLVRPDFVYSVSRDFVRSCQTPMLVMPDDTAAHAYQAAIDVASLAPNAEITVYPWKDPPELKARTINRVRTFLKRHQPATAAR